MKAYGCYGTLFAEPRDCKSVLSFT